MALYKYKNGKLVKVAGNYGSNRTLLWTNHSPSSSFSAGGRTVKNMADYDEIEIIFFSDTTQQLSLKTTFNKGTWTCLFRVSGGSSTGPRNIYRFVQYTNDTTITFESCWNAVNNTEYQADGELIPYKIYGVKVGS